MRCKLVCFGKVSSGGCWQGRVRVLDQRRKGLGLLEDLVGVVKS